ncbi:MAG: porin, partial [Armatimonadetes bacterium]|nr:porin [Armatimonadota bacterium]
AYWRRQIRDSHFLTLRAEWLRDADGFATGSIQDVKELTLTYELPAFMLRGALLRLELRHDWSNASVFDAGTKRNQTTFVIGIVQQF